MQPDGLGLKPRSTLSALGNLEQFTYLPGASDASSFVWIHEKEYAGKGYGTVRGRSGH